MHLVFRPTPSSIALRAACGVEASERVLSTTEKKLATCLGCIRFMGQPARHGYHYEIPRRERPGTAIDEERRELYSREQGRTRAELAHALGVLAAFALGWALLTLGQAG